MKQKWLAMVAVGAMSLFAAEVPRVVAHRGNMQYDDNALGGFQQSLAAGVTGFETDVQMTSDGGFVLMHDDTIDRTTEGTGYVKNMTLADVTALKLKKSRENVPTLQQLADIFQSRSDVFVEFEMKSQGFTGATLEQYVDGLYQTVSTTMPAGTYIFTSFDQDYLSAMKTRHPAAPMAFILSGAQTDTANIQTAVNLGCSQISPGVGTGKDWVDAAHAAGLNVALWMVQDLSTWQSCRMKGANSTTSDHPIELLASVNHALAVEDQGTEWTGQRYFTNDAPWTIGVALTGAEGLGKWGSGDLTITSKSAFTGDVILAGGRTFLQVENDVKNATSGALGNPRVARTIMVTNGAELCIMGKNAIAGGGTSDTPPLSELHIADAAIHFQTNFSCNLGDVYFHNADVTYFGGFQYSWRHWGTLLCRNLYFSGTKTYTFPKNGDTVNNANKPDNNCGLLIGKWAPNKMGEIRVPNMSGDNNVDVDFGWNLFHCVSNNGTSDGCLGSFRKTGDGTLQLSSSESNFQGDIRVEEGTLKLTGGTARLGNDRSVLGALKVAHTNYIGPGATLWLAVSDLQGQMYNNSKIVTYVNGGTLKQDAGKSNGMGPVILENATLDYAGHQTTTYYYGVKDANGQWHGTGETILSHWGTFAFNGGLWVKGTNVLTLANKKQGNTGSSLYFGANGMSDVRVDDITKNANSDLIISMPILESNIWAARNSSGFISGTNHVATPVSFRKTGPGTLELSGDASGSDYRGDVEVAEGVLKLNHGNSGWTRFYTEQSILGSTEKPHTITVLEGGEILFATPDVMGQLAKLCPGPTIVASNGTVRINNASCNGMPKLRFFNGSFIYGNGGVGARHWGICGFNSLVEFDGDNGEAYEWPNVAQNNWMNLGYAGGMTVTTNADNTVLFKGYTEMRVHNVTGDANVDATIHPILQDIPDWDSRNNSDTVIGKKKVYYSCGLRKTGLGTLRLTNVNIYTGATEVVEGSLLVDSPTSKSAITVKNGGFLGGMGTVKDVVVEAGGGFTAAPGQATALTVQNCTLPEDGVVRLDVKYVGDLEEVESVRVPVVNADELAGVTWVCTINGGEPPPNYRVRAAVVGGTVYGHYSRSGLTVILR